MTEHPRIFIKEHPCHGLRTIADFRGSVETGWMKSAWHRLCARADQAVNRGPILPEGVNPNGERKVLPLMQLGFPLCNEVGQQLVRLALVHLITGQTKYKDAALAQMEALFDPTLWPEWTDHLVDKQFGHRASLRTGMLAQDVAVAYDWLYQSLTEQERAWVIEGVDRRGIQPYLESLGEDPWWTHDLNNCMTVIVGGLGIVGMVFDGEHPESRRLIDYAVLKMEEYLLIYGEEGELNESVGYGSSNRLPINFFQAHRYWSDGEQNRLSAAPFPQMCAWAIRTTLPPGREAGFGDAKPERAVISGYVGSVAAATRNGVLQWYFNEYHSATSDPYQLVSYDQSVEPKAPDEDWPLFKAYKSHGKIVVSRSDWDPREAACIVYAKAGREKHHAHNDVGQLCVDGYGERLIIDPGSPSTYPVAFFDEGRYHYYNASIIGHNVLMFDRAEPRYPHRKRGENVDMELFSGRVVKEHQVPGVGAAWKMDLTAAYDGVEKVTRTVLHLLPGYIAVLDEAGLGQAADISLRWHYLGDLHTAGKNGFSLVKGKARLSGIMVSLENDRELEWVRRAHEYSAPYHMDPFGQALEQRRENYLEMTGHATGCRWLSLFRVQARNEAEGDWVRTDQGWRCGDVHLIMQGDTLRLGYGENLSAAISL